jgi:hypothetical protein
MWLVPGSPTSDNHKLSAPHGHKDDMFSSSFFRAAIDKQGVTQALLTFFFFFW